MYKKSAILVGKNSAFSIVVVKIANFSCWKMAQPLGHFFFQNQKTPQPNQPGVSVFAVIHRENRLSTFQDRHVPVLFNGDLRPSSKTDGNKRGSLPKSMLRLVYHVPRTIAITDYSLPLFCPFSTFLRRRNSSKAGGRSVGATARQKGLRDLTLRYVVPIGRGSGRPGRP